MVVRAKAGYRQYAQEFSIGMTDPRYAQFSNDRKRAGQWPAHTTDDGVLDGAWHCDSINLQNMIVDYESYEKRFTQVESICVASRQSSACSEKAATAPKI